MEAPNALTNDTTPTLSGTSETGAVVTVSVDGVTLTGVSAGGGVWSVTYAAAPLGYGVHNVAMTATDPAENVASLTQSLTVDNIAPSIAIDGGAAEATNDRTPTISGNTNVAAGVTVNIAIGTAPAMTALVQSNSTWNATPSALLDPGTYSLVASVADMAGNIGTYSQSLVDRHHEPDRVDRRRFVTIDGHATPTITGSSLDVASAQPSLSPSPDKRCRRRSRLMARSRHRRSDDQRRLYRVRQRHGCRRELRIQ